MTEREPDDLDDFAADELAILAGARRALDPRPEDAARVLHATRLGIAADADRGRFSVSRFCHRTIAAFVTFCKTEKPRTVPYPLLALALIGVSGGVGYKLGVRAGIEQARAPHTTDVARIVIAKQTPVAPSTPAAATNSDRIDRPSELALADATPAQRVQADAGVARSQPRRAKPGPGLEPAIAAASTPEPSDEAVALQSLDPEVRALKQIERALRKREPERALDLLRQLDRDVPAGKLIEERAAARAMARCELLAGSATASSSMAIALEFSQRYPASVYFARVRETCRAAIDRGRATDSLAR